MKRIVLLFIVSLVAFSSSAHQCLTKNPVSTGSGKGKSVTLSKPTQSRLYEGRKYLEKQSASCCDLSRFELSLGMTDMRNHAKEISK